MPSDFERRSRVGSLDATVTFERQTVTISPTGSESKVWDAITTVRCHTSELYGREYMEADQRFSTATTTFQIRYSSTVKSIGTRDRISYRGVLYNIVGFDRKPTNRPKWLTFFAVSADNVEIQS